jgi:hypothetical protein
MEPVRPIVVVIGLQQVNDWRSPRKIVPATRDRRRQNSMFARIWSQAMSYF